MTNTMTDTELVAYLRFNGEGTWMAFQLPRDNDIMMEEAGNLIDGAFLPGHTDSDEDGPLVTIEYRRKPAGFVDSLPEFQGW